MTRSCMAGGFIKALTLAQLQFKVSLFLPRLLHVRYTQYIAIKKVLFFCILSTSEKQSY